MTTNHSSADRDALARLWDAARPVEPTDAAWDALWARVTDRLDQQQPAEAPTVLAFSPWRRISGRVLIAAQAAAILMAAFLAARHRPVTESHAPTPLAQIAMVHEWDFPPGIIPMIRQDDKGVRFVAFAQDERSNALVGPLDGNFAMYDYMEGLAD
jgi:hypothetical protein